MSDSFEAIRQEMLQYLIDRGEAVSVETVADDLGLEQQYTRKVLRHLRNGGDVRFGSDGFEAVDTTGSPFDGRPANIDVVRSEEEVAQVMRQLDAYPFGSGHEAATYRGARMILSWLTGESDSFDVNGVGLRRIGCLECGWAEAGQLHTGRVPEVCPKCDTVGSIEAETVDD